MIRRGSIYIVGGAYEMMNVITVLTTILVATVTAQEETLTLKYASLVSNLVALI